MTSSSRTASPTGPSRARWEKPGVQGHKPRTSSPAPGASRLAETTSFGANPGRLRMLSYAPRELKAGAPLVVVLHGCTQNAVDYDRNAGWTALAEEAGFAVLYPEQVRSNNPQGCFNWFRASDAARGLGETRSIHEMIEHLAAKRSIDRSRIYVTGLSAGGAMASALLADYPEMFAGGAIIAGLACGAASNIGEAFEAMSRPRTRSAEELGDAVRSSSSHEGPWPIVSIWHGAADTTVVPKNADEIVKQWADVHHVALEDFREETVGRHVRRVWSVGGRDVIERYVIAGMGHGAPLDARAGEQPGPFMLDARLSSTRRVADFWGIAAVEMAKKAAPAAAETKSEPEKPEPEPRPYVVPLPRSTEAIRLWAERAAARLRADQERAAASQKGATNELGAVITKALRAAGLMR